MKPRRARQPLASLREEASAHLNCRHRRRTAQQGLQGKGETTDRLISDQKPPSYLEPGTVMSATSSIQKATSESQRFPLSIGSVSLCLMSAHGFTGDLESHIQSGDRAAGKRGGEKLFRTGKKVPQYLFSFLTNALF